MTHQTINKKLYWVAIVALALLVLCLWAIAWLSFTPKFATGKCSDFGSYEDIKVSFNQGNRGLDGDGDGIPCENRK